MGGEGAAAAAAGEGTNGVGNSRSGRGGRRAAVKHGVQASVARLARDRSNDSGSWLGGSRAGGGSLSSYAGSSSSSSDSDDSEEEQMRAASGGGSGGRGRGRGGDLSGRGKEVRAADEMGTEWRGLLQPFTR